MTDRPASVGRLSSLTGLRFASAFGIFGVHFAPYLGGHVQGVVNRLFGSAANGVSFFFILSGVVLTWSRHPGDTKRRFYQRRFARVYPDYLAAWLITIAVIAYEGAAFYLHPGVLSLGLVQAWAPQPSISQGWNGVSWTLSCEAFFYLMFPFIVGRVERLHRPIALVPFLCLPTLVLGIIGLVHYPHDSPQTLVWLQTIFPPTRLCEFVVGIAIAVELRRGSLPQIRPRLAGAIFVSAYVLFSWAPLRWVTPPLFIPVLVLVMISASQRDLAGHKTFWASRPLILLGERSYAFYLLHQLVIRAWARADHNHLPASGVAGVLWFVVLMAVAIAAAAILFSVIEVPFERRLRGASAPRLELDDDAPATLNPSESGPGTSEG
jgi:peptidoglycan/LPS O-acetylase OafA/YrhL